MSYSLSHKNVSVCSSFVTGGAFLKETSLFILLNLTSVCNSSSVCASDHQATEHALVSTLISALCHVTGVTPLSLLTVHSDKLLCYLSSDKLQCSNVVYLTLAEHFSNISVKVLDSVFHCSDVLFLNVIFC